MKEKRRAREQEKARYARKRVEWLDRRKLLRMFMRPCSPILFLFLAFTSFGQVYVVLTDTNQVKLLPANVKVAWYTNLYLAEITTDVTTNWSMIGPPVDVKSNGIVTARRIYQAGTLVTNTYYRIRFGDVEQVVPLSLVTGPIIEAKPYDVPPPLPTPGTTIPLEMRERRR